MERLSAWLVRCFPQIHDLLQYIGMLTDTIYCRAKLEIQMAIHLGIPDPLANCTMEPSRIVARREFSVVLCRLNRTVGAISDRGRRIVTSDVASSRSIDQDVRLVLGYGLRSWDKAENPGAGEPVTGKDAVNAELQRISFL